MTITANATTAITATRTIIVISVISWRSREVPADDYRFITKARPRGSGQPAPDAQRRAQTQLQFPLHATGPARRHPRSARRRLLRGGAPRPLAGLRQRERHRDLACIRDRDCRLCNLGAAGLAGNPRRRVPGQFLEYRRTAGGAADRRRQYSRSACRRDLRAAVRRRRRRLRRDERHPALHGGGGRRGVAGRDGRSARAGRDRARRALRSGHDVDHVVGRRHRRRPAGDAAAHHLDGAAAHALALAALRRSSRAVSHSRGGVLCRVRALAGRSPQLPADVRGAAAARVGGAAARAAGDSRGAAGDRHCRHPGNAAGLRSVRAPDAERVAASAPGVLCA